ncbi:hypothetical protein ACGF5O_22050 [Streptomyces sp. NPDC048291]|uniref:hypothetical protein n=1 Tax=Streptomyces sp. NPDC048291 TaxID=3365530 RepID=UPI003723B007
MMFGSGSKLTFRDYVQGTWGSFSTPAGQVDYIMTKARLGDNSDDPERQLTKSLAPVREVMPAEALDFNQLLQRDLDDHRVAVNLISYLLKPQSTGPAFFPPIVAVLLPFKSDGTPTVFPELGEETRIEADGAPWQQVRAESSFQVQRLMTPDGELHGANVGKLWWNRSKAQLVVLDGQHRAMALLAVERTQTNSWQTSAGARFKSFYENQVKQVLKEQGREGFDLSKVEVPVTVCWFPDQTGEQSDPHRSARKLFVDVNKEAKPPSKSRIILLSDGELGNVLTRRMLSELRSRSDDSYLPLYAVEYDNPEVNSSRPARWSVLTNIDLLKFAVDRCIFGPPKYLKDVTLKFVGRPSPADRDSFMREQLDIFNLFPAQFEDGGISYQREKLGDEDFPLGQVDVISEQFAATWGKAILTLLSKTEPYAAHASALTQLKDDWHVDDLGMNHLAHDALFGGVGVFWTLKDSYDHFLEKRALSDRKISKSDVILAWETLRKREELFEALRVQTYLDSGSPANLRRCKAAYAVFNTHACQLGMVMTLASLWELRKDPSTRHVDLKELPAFAEALAAGWNAFFAQDHGKGRDRKVAFNKSEISTPLNQINNMDTPQSVYFRYFWMQALATPAAWEHVAHWFPKQSDFEDMLSSARDSYLKLCIDQQIKALRTSHPELKDDKRRSQAEKSASSSLKQALRNWFFMSDEAYQIWYESRGQGTAPEPSFDDLGASDEVAESEEDDATADVAPATQLSDLIDED